jgi:Ca2+-transporting ATPase
MVFVTLILAELVNAFNCRSDYLSLFKVGVCRNRFLLLSVIVSLGLMFLVIEWDPLADLFHVTHLGWREWIIAVVLSLILVPVVEGAKWALRRGKE